MGNIIDFQNTQYITLETAKAWLNIEPQFEDDDLLIYGLIDVAQAAVEKYIDRPLEDIAQDGVLPSCLKQAMLFLIGTYYAQRESISSGTMNAVPHTFEMLCDLYTNYDYKKSINYTGE
jgi:hypothetical protein